MNERSMTYTPATLRVRPGQKLEQKDSEKIHFTTEMKIEFTKKICALYSLGRYTLEECCKRYGIKQAKFRRWILPHLDIEQMILDGEDLPVGFVMECREMYADAKIKAVFNYKESLADITRKGLLKRAEGYETEEYTEERVLDTAPKTAEGDANPNFGELITVKQKVKRYTVAPDPTTLIFAATNMMPDTFKHRNVIDHSGNINISNTGLENLTDTQLKEKRAELALRNERLRQAHAIKKK